MSKQRPTDVEAKRLVGFRGNEEELIEGEKWMLGVARQAVPNMKRKVEVCLTAKSFHAKHAAIQAQVAVVSMSAVRLMQSQRLRRIFEHLLAIGNMMNDGARGSIANARGFTIDSLLKLAETRATHAQFKRLNLLEFFVGMVADRGSLRLLD